jgi:hypothetical protein
MHTDKKEDTSKEELSLSKITFIAAFIASRGNVSKACQTAQMARSTYYLWKRTDLDFVQQLQEAKEELEEYLFEKVYEFGVDGDITAAIFSLKSLNREKYDDAFARQKYILDRGATPHDAPLVQSRIVIVRDSEPERLKGTKATDLYSSDVEN